MALRSADTTNAALGSKPQVRRLVLDAGAFISGSDALFTGGGLREVGPGGQKEEILSDDIPCELYTVDEVVNEIRDNKARRRLKLLQGNLQIKTPTNEGVAAVIQFAKSTGDFATLSLADIKVLALAYMMEVEVNGTKYVKSAPLKPKFRARRLMTLAEYDEWETQNKNKKLSNKHPSATSFEDEEDIGNNLGSTKEEWKLVESRGWVKNSRREREREKNGRRRQRRRGQNQEERNAVSDMEFRSECEDLPREGALSKEVDSEKSCRHGLEYSEAKKEHFEGEIQSGSREDIAAQCDEDPSSCMVHDIQSDDDAEWITNENVDEHLARDQLGALTADDQVFRVGCVTNDFAMQNVLLQMGMKLLSVDGRSVVRKVKRYVLLCESCNAQTQEVERKFCPRCGNATLFRAAYTIDRKGIARVHLSAKHKPRIRGTKYPIPMPRGGRRNRDLILSEDQIDPQKLRRMTKAKEHAARDILDPNSLYNASALHDPIKPIVVGYGRRNPNAVLPKQKGKKSRRKKRQ